MGVLLRILVAAGLAADAYVHWVFAPDMDPGPNAPSGVIPGDVLFQAQAIVAAVAGLLVLAWARRWTYAIAFLVAASAVGALLLYYYVDVGRLGPIPAMHDPSWYAEKTISGVGEGVAALAALIGFFTVNRNREDEDPFPANGTPQFDRMR
ncbi:hypothetical protein Acsp03_03190 [Actinomadura sp. NBRC 104412]|uniref:hypothetical protein n=1 Tax=Actinomadura sp. NBRC 104412 TaxID=3032203 RepID=UPI0024A23C50|nr:hypothetical protein [Actinomadura sp. NBRC 104412]GLZ02852.1 hypothetical protein Acsp03_03190 [Actinomadura sp. NBRC 104412]